MRKLTLSIVIVAFFASCVMQKNVCDRCIKQNTDIIKSDTTFINDTVTVVSIKEGATITTIIDCDSVKSQTIYDTNGLSLKVQQGQGSKVLIKTVQQTRIDTVKTIIKVPVQVNYHADIAKFKVVSDSLNAVITTLERDNKRFKRHLKRSNWVCKFAWVFFITTFLLLVVLFFIIRKIREL